MTRLSASVLAMAMAGCTSPDVSAHLTATRTAYTSLQTQIGPDYAQKAKDEKAAAEARAIQTTSAVISYAGDCDYAAARESIAVLSNCTEVSYVDPAAEPGHGTEITDFLTLLDGYLTALEAIATSQSPAEARAQAQAVIEAFGQPDPARPKAFEQLGRVLRERQAVITQVTEFAVKQARVSALRRATQRAGPILIKAVPVVAELIEEQDTPLIEAQERLLEAQLAVNDLEGSNRPLAYRDAIKEAREAHKAFLTAQTESAGTKLYLLLRAHDQLIARLKPGADAEEFVDLLETLRDLRDAAKPETDT